MFKDVSSLHFIWVLRYFDNKVKQWQEPTQISGCLYLGIRVILCTIKTYADINLLSNVFGNKGQRFIVIGDFLQCENACATISAAAILQESLRNYLRASPPNRPKRSTKYNYCATFRIPEIARNCCAILWIAPLCRDRFREKSLQHLLIDTMSSPCQAQEWSSRVGFPDGS